jgi:hypothetical protein
MYVAFSAFLNRGSRVLGFRSDSDPEVDQRKSGRESKFLFSGQKSTFPERQFVCDNCLKIQSLLPTDSKLEAKNLPYHKDQILFSTLD